MLNEKREKGPSKDAKQMNDLLMKPFSLGWTREVVRRVITKNGTPNCDIYYFSPSGKKIRSLTEVKGNLTDGLSPECFSFKRESLGLAPNFETVRDARVRRKTDEKSNDKGKCLRGTKRTEKPEKSQEEGDESTKEGKKKKTETEEQDLSKSKSETEDKDKEKEDNSEGNSSKEKVQKKKDVEEPENKSRRVRQEKRETRESRSYSNRKKSKTKAEKPMIRTSSVRSQSLKRRKEVLKKIRNAKQAKQTKVLPGKKILKKIVRKKVAAPQKRKLSKRNHEKDASRKNKNKLISKRTIKKAMKTKTEAAKEEEVNEIDEKPAPTDLKSIVKNNIGKYREMREKQKLGVMKAQMRNPTKKIVLGVVSRARSEPISKNKLFYLKPLENGWRRELVFRTNCARAGQQADVYYFHPNGKKLRSCREIAENLTHGLSIECFTFRKEPIGCGEPSEVIRNARSHQKGFSTN